MQKDNGIYPALILALICLIATALLAFTNQLTMAPRLQQAIDAENANRIALFPDATEFVEYDFSQWQTDEMAVKQIYEVFDQEGLRTGFLFTASTRGYGGFVPIMTALDEQGKVTGIRVLSNEETPGLGKKIEEKVFLDQFIGADTSIIYTTKPDEPGRESIDSVSGATISSRAVSESINAINALYSEIIKEES